MSVLRISEQGKLLFHPEMLAALAEAPAQCAAAFDIALIGEDHPGCVLIDITAGRTRLKTTPTPEQLPPEAENGARPGQYYLIAGGPGKFSIGAAWDSGHSPYPSIRDMTAYIFGVRIQSDFPKQGVDIAPGQYRHIASVRINIRGDVYVNGAHAGNWPKFAIPKGIGIRYE